MIKFIFFGRLQYEKGIDLVLEVFPKLHSAGITSRSLDIYGSGKFSKACEALSQLLPDHVTFHGRKDQKAILQKLSEADYCLMPSRVIETFGLSALESLRQGVPVIGFKKGGLENFILNDLDITTPTQSDAGEKLYSLLSDICKNNISKHTFPIGPELLGLSAYTPDAWLENFKALAGDAKRILIVSDFIKKIGGIESYIHDVKELLESHGYEVRLRGTNKKVSFRGLFKTAFNLAARGKLHNEILYFKPDIIWYNSVIRELGRLPVAEAPKHTKILMMFHDMGYFVPRPSKLYAMHRTPKSMSLGRWLQLSHSKNPASYILSAFKWLSLRLIRGVLRRRNTTYLVPSSFMLPLSKRLWQGRNQKTVVLPHFVK